MMIISCCVSYLGHECLYLVDPENHSILQVKGQLLRGTEGREALDRGHHFLYADHLHCVSHHQGIDHGHVSTLSESQEQSTWQFNPAVFFFRFQCKQAEILKFPKHKTLQSVR